MKGVLIRLLLAAAALFPAACSSVPEGWEAALAVDPKADPVAGAWRGRWRSEVNGHEGILLCAVKRSDGAGKNGHCAFRYRADWGRIFSARFAIDCSVTPDGRVSGSKDLGPLFGGVFSHEGKIDGKTFRARYSSSLDQGVLELERAAPR